MMSSTAKLISAADRGDIDACRAAIEAGADVHFEDASAFRLAAASGNAPIMSLLIKAGVKPSQEARGALADAAWGQRMNAVRLLVEAGVPINEHSGMPLFWAFFNADLPLIRFLVSRGAQLREFSADNLVNDVMSSRLDAEALQVLLDHPASQLPGEADALRALVSKSEHPALQALRNRISLERCAAAITIDASVLEMP